VARKAAQADLQAAAEGHGGRQNVVSSLQVTTGERECRGYRTEGRDHLGRVFALGTLLGRGPDGGGPTSSTLRVLPLDTVDRRRRRR
jgi:hypothetical protein